MIRKTAGIEWDREEEMRRRSKTRMLNNIALERQNTQNATAIQNRNNMAQAPNKVMSYANTPSKVQNAYGAMQGLLSGSAPVATSSAAPLAVNASPAAAEMALAAQSAGYAPAVGTLGSEGATLANAAHGANVGAASAAPATGSASGGSAAGASGGGAMATLGWVAAAIALQNQFTNMTNRETDGVKTGNAFTGQYGTEPWLAYGAQLAKDDDPTAGEKFDAAVVNNDKSAMAKTAPAVANYWVNPDKEALAIGSGALGKKVAGDFGEKSAKWGADPIGQALRLLW